MTPAAAMFRNCRRSTAAIGVGTDKLHAYVLAAGVFAGSDRDRTDPCNRLLETNHGAEERIPLDDLGLGWS